VPRDCGRKGLPRTLTAIARCGGSCQEASLPDWLAKSQARRVRRFLSYGEHSSGSYPRPQCNRQRVARPPDSSSKFTGTAKSAVGRVGKSLEWASYQTTEFHSSPIRGRPPHRPGPGQFPRVSFRNDWNRRAHMHRHDALSSNNRFLRRALRKRDVRGTLPRARRAARLEMVAAIETSLPIGPPEPRR
jgi:hypothetical protein